MTAIWIDAQISPAVALWINDELGVQAHALRDLGLRDVDDMTIFCQACESRAIILTKDADFPLLLAQRGPPPRVIWLTCGNTTNAALHRIIAQHAHELRVWIDGNGPLIELR